MKNIPILNFVFPALSAGFLLSGFSQAATVTSIDGNGSVADFSNQVFDEAPLTLTTNVNNLGNNDNFTNAVFTGTTFNVGSIGGANGNQPFVNTTITGADFSGTTFNFNLFENASGQRPNFFRLSTGGNTSFANSIWNIGVSAAELDANNSDLFTNGAGATGLADAASAHDFTGADFSFSGAGASTIASEVANLLITNLGSTGTGATAFGAQYDPAFVANNFADFGFADAATLDSALINAGWQVVPEPSSLALIGLTLGAGLVRRRRS